MKKDRNNNTESIYCYRDEETIDLIKGLKHDKDFYKKESSLALRKVLCEKISTEFQDFSAGIIVAVPSTSFWHSRKSFDHLNIFINKILKNDKNKYLKYLPYAIIPRLYKSNQKNLNKIQRFEQSQNAYSLSLSFRDMLKRYIRNQAVKYKKSAMLSKNHLSLRDGSVIHAGNRFLLDQNLIDYNIESSNYRKNNYEEKLKILIIDDLRTTGATLTECSNAVNNFIDKLFDINKIHPDEREKIEIKCLTVAYEP